MKWPPLKVLEALVQHAWPILRTTFRPDCCIAATRIGIEVLRRFGIAGQARCCLTVAANRSCVAWMERDNADEPPPPDARFIAIAPNPEGTGFPGHLVITCKVQGQHYLLDLSAPQLHRPEKGILVPEGLLARMPGPWGAEITGPLEDGGRLSYKAHPDPNLRWEETPDWRIRPANREHFSDLCAQITRKVESAVSLEAAIKHAQDDLYQSPEK